MEQFYLEELKLKNYRRFSQQTFRFNRHMNILVGSNASGKTTVLESACVALGAYLAAYKKYVPSRFVFNISEWDVHRKLMRSDQDDILISPSIGQYPCLIDACLFMGEKRYHYKRVLEKSEGRTKFDGKNPMQKQIVHWEELMSAADGSDRQIIFPLVLYLSSARLWNEDNSKQESGIPGRMEAYYRCLDKKRGIQLPFNYIKKMIEISAQEKDGVAFPAYTLIMEAIRKSIQEELVPGQRIEYSSRYNGLALVDPDGTWVPFQGLSDGYRGVIKIVADIAARICILNPYLKESALEETPGIVIIDELDLSLHPSWQKRIVNILVEIFPKIQFICASHSPFIIQSLKDGQLISLDGKIESSYSGQSIEDIAEDIMGVENPQYSDEKQEMFELAETYFAELNKAGNRNELDLIRQKLDYLTARFGDNPAYYAFLKQKYLEKKMELE